MRVVALCLALCAAGADYVRTTSWSSTDCGLGGDAALQTTVTNFACVANEKLSCVTGGSYVINTYAAGAGCTGAVVNASAATALATACTARVAPTLTSFERAACVSGDYDPASRAGVSLTTYGDFPSNLTCAQAANGAGFTPTAYVDIGAACQRYNTGGGDDDDAGGGVYLSYTIACVAGGVRTTYYKGINCMGTTDTYMDQKCDSGIFGNWVWSCPAPAPAAANTGAIVGGVLGGLAAVGLAVALILPGSRASIFGAFSKAKAGAVSAATGGASTYEAMPLKGTA